MPPLSSSTNLLELFGAKPPLAVCPFKEMGFVCFDGESLVFVSMLTPKSPTDAPVFVRTSTIHFDFKPPAVDEVTAISLSASGRFLALTAERCAFVTEMPADFWNGQALFQSHSVGNLRSEYTAKCEILNVNLVLSKRQHDVRKVVWLRPPHGFSGLASVLGVLYANSVIRVYDVEASKSAPIAVADFQRILGCRLDDTQPVDRGANRFGLITELVSFDFGPCLRYDESVYLTLFGVDSDGELFYAASGTKGEPTIEPVGPLTFEGIDPRFNSFYFNSTELLFVQHANSAEMPVFAFCSDQGEIFHVVLVQNHPLHYLVENGRNIFEPTIVDSFQVEDWPLRNPNVSLFNDFDHKGEYFVMTATDVYLVDPTAWMHQFGVAMDEPEASTVDNVPASIVRHFFKLVHPQGPSGAPKADVAIRSTASIRVEADGVPVEGSDLSLFLVLDASPRITANFVQRRLKGAAKKRKPSSAQPAGRPPTDAAGLPVRPPLNLAVPPLRTLPKIAITALGRNQRMETVTKAIQQTNEQLQILLPCVQDAQKKSEQLVHRFDHLEQAHKHCSDRLFKIFETLHHTKRQLLDLKEKKAGMEMRYNQLADKIENALYAPSAAEDAYVSRLRAAKKDAEKFAKRLQQFTSKLVEINARYASGTKSFVASASAQKFMLSKHAVEIAQLQNQLDRATRDYAQFVRSDEQ